MAINHGVAGAGKDNHDDPVVTVVNELKAREGLLVNRSGRACISLPSRGAISLDSRHAHHWLAAQYCTITGRCPTQGQLQMLAMVLQGIAADLPAETSDDPELWDRIDHEPVLQAVMACLEDSAKGYFLGTMTDLRKLITASARERQIPMTSSWPATANQLGRQLNQLEPLLRAAGYALSRRATNTTRLVHISPIPVEGDDDSAQSSPMASPHNIDDAMHLGIGDDNDARERLRQAIDRM